MVDLEEYLRQSNAIESVHDDEALEDAVTAWEFLESKSTLSHDIVKETHRLVLTNRQPGIAGSYRDVRVTVGGDLPPPPGDVPGKMTDLLQWTPSDPLDAIAWHIKFEQIHPFADGNGRVGRLLYLWHCREVLGVEPILWREPDKEGYYALFDSKITHG